MLLSLLISLVLADPAGSTPAGGGATLQVPYLPQTEALCGGAAAAMLFRYWGDRHADVQQFEPLVDHSAGGIADIALERAIRERSWTVARVDGTVAAIRSHLAAGQPLMLLIEVRPQRYHYVVAVGADDEAVLVHDPAWGPSRRFTLAQLERAWQPTGYWALLVLPDPARRRLSDAPPSDPPSAPPSRTDAPAAIESASATLTDCDRLIDAALDELGTRGLDAADQLLGAVRSRCPQSSRPLAELAAVRFSQHRAPEAVTLAEQAVRLNRADTYAWDVLGSSRFIADDPGGALQAWNQVGKPRLDLVHIEGLHRTRYALVAAALQLTPNTLLTEPDYRRAGRRLQQLPDRLASRIGYRPAADGYAVVDVAIVERPARPVGAFQWGAAGARALIDRELTVAVPGGTGQGEVWSGSWRWWRDRPRLAFGFAAPRTGRLPGVWQAEGSWEAQTYAVNGAVNGAVNDAAVRDSRSHAGIGLGDWITSTLRYQVAAGLDDWNRSDRAASIGATLERRLFADRLSLAASGTNWLDVSGGPGFRSGSLALQVRSSDQAGRLRRSRPGAVRGRVALGTAGVVAGSR